MFDAIVVTFNPEEQVTELVETLLNNSQMSVTIVDNASVGRSASYLDRLAKLPRVELRKLEANMGIAFAQNVGIRIALANKAKYLLFFDQDSHVSSTFVESLWRKWQLIFATDPMIGILAPSYQTESMQTINKFYCLDGDGKYRHHEVKHSYQPVLKVISSGSIISAKCIQRVGCMDESFFIDQVDTEFCARAISMDFHVYATSEVLLQHKIGSGKNIGVNKLRLNINEHNAIRKYYFIRNSILMLKKGSIPRPLIKWTFYEMAYTFLSSLLFEQQKLSKMKLMLRGAADGIKGTSGKYIER